MLSACLAPRSGSLASNARANKHAQRLDLPAGDGVMNRRDLENIGRGIACLRRRRLPGQVLVQGLKLAKKRVREDVLFRAVAEQDGLDIPAPLQARGAKWRDEDQAVGTVARQWDRRRLIHVDALLEQKLDDGHASGEHREPQQFGGVGCRRQDIGRLRQQLAQRGGMAPAHEVNRMDGGLVAQTRPVRPARAAPCAARFR